jgi:hypothetical protein
MDIQIGGSFTDSSDQTSLGIVWNSILANCHPRPFGTSSTTVSFEISTCVLRLHDSSLEGSSSFINSSRCNAIRYPTRTNQIYRIHGTHLIGADERYQGTESPPMDGAICGSSPTIGASRTLRPSRTTARERGSVRRIDRPILIGNKRLTPCHFFRAMNPFRLSPRERCFYTAFLQHLFPGTIYLHLCHSLPPIYSPNCSYFLFTESLLRSQASLVASQDFHGSSWTYPGKTCKPKCGPSAPSACDTMSLKTPRRR